MDSTVISDFLHGVEEIALRLRLNAEVGVREQTVERAAKRAVAIGRPGVRVFPRPDILIAFGRQMNVKVVERLVLDLIRVFVAPAVVAAQPKHLCGLRNEDGKDDRKIETVDLLCRSTNRNPVPASPVTFRCCSWWPRFAFRRVRSCQLDGSALRSSTSPPRTTSRRPDEPIGGRRRAILTQSVSGPFPRDIVGNVMPVRIVLLFLASTRVLRRRCTTTQPTILPSVSRPSAGVAPDRSRAARSNATRVDCSAPRVELMRLSPRAARLVPMLAEEVSSVDHPAGTGTRPAAGLRRGRGHAPGSRQGPHRPILRPPRDGVSELDARVQRLLAAERRAVGGAVTGRVLQLAEPLHDEEGSHRAATSSIRTGATTIGHTRRSPSTTLPATRSCPPAVLLSLSMPTPGRHRTARWTAHLLRALRRRRVSRSIREGPRRCASAIRDRPP